jgi:hypothetical protein
VSHCAEFWCFKPRGFLVVSGCGRLDVRTTCLTVLSADLEATRTWIAELSGKIQRVFQRLSKVIP